MCLCATSTHNRLKGGARPLQARTESGQKVQSEVLRWADEPTMTQLMIDRDGPEVDHVDAEKPAYSDHDTPPAPPRCVGVCWQGQCNLKLFNALYNPHRSGCCYAGPSEASAGSVQAAPAALRYSTAGDYVCWGPPPSRNTYHEDGMSHDGSGDRPYHGPYEGQRVTDGIDDKEDGNQGRWSRQGSGGYEGSDDAYDHSDDRGADGHHDSHRYGHGGRRDYVGDGGMGDGRRAGL